MTVKTGATWAGTFVTLDATGALAAGTPSGTLYVDGVANAAEVTITGSNPYKFSVTLPALTAGQRVDMYITATISGIATAAIVASEQADTRLLSDGVTLADDAITAATIKADAGAEIADAVWDEAISGHVTAGTFGAKNQKVVPSETLNDYKADVSLLATNTGMVTLVGHLDTEIAAIKAKTNNLPASPAASGEYTSALSAIQADLDNPNQYKADVSGLALEATLTAIKGAEWTNETLTKIVADIAAISAGSGAIVADILNALLASYTDSGSVGEALGRLDNIQAKTDLITTGTALTVTSAVVGSTITAHRGDTLSAALENIGALTNYSKLWFTVKRDYDDADSAAVIQIEKTGGLLYLNGAAGTTGNGSLTINDEATGDVTIVLNASETAKLSPGNYQYDIQILRSAGTPVSTLTYGEFVVAADVTRATS